MQSMNIGIPPEFQQVEFLEVEIRFSEFRHLELGLGLCLGLW